MVSSGAGKGGQTRSILYLGDEFSIFFFKSRNPFVPQTPPHLDWQDPPFSGEGGGHLGHGAGKVAVNAGLQFAFYLFAII